MLKFLNEEQKKNLKIIIIAILIGALIFFGNSRAVLTLRGGAVRILEPLMGVSKRVNRMLGAVFGGLSRDEAKELILENQRLKVSDLQFEELQRRNNFLERMLDFRERKNLSLIGSHVKLHSQEFGKDFLLIDQGKESGIEDGDWVVSSEDVLVGFVKAVGNGFSNITIASNSDETFEVEIIPQGVRALAKGIGGRTLSLELIPANTPVQRGDFIALRNNKGVSLLIGEIINVHTTVGAAFEEANATLLARPELLDNVFIIKKSK